ncbi:MAG: hypothetical protein GY832_00435, partial [Chloroflexi bacterium]|nr:hypothetical protein [Chloroflexota bacterium]
MFVVHFFCHASIDTIIELIGQMCNSDFLMCHCHISLGVDMLVAEHVTHEEYSVKRGAVAVTVGAAGGLIGGYFIPGASSVLGSGTTKVVTALGATEAASTIIGTGATVAADAAMAAGTNA